MTTAIKIADLTTRELIEMFDKINSDRSEEEYVPLTDIDYYSEQQDCPIDNNNHLQSNNSEL